MRCAALALAVAAGALAAAPVQAADEPGGRADPQAALPAVAALLAASSMDIASRASCSGRIPGVSHPTLGALVASRIAYLGRGDNRVEGACTRGRAPDCRVVVTHADGEDVASAEFRFRTRAGRLDPASLVCVLTP